MSELRTSDVLSKFADEVQEIERRLRATTISDVAGRTADVKEVALLRLRQAADTMAVEAVMLERVGE